MKIDSKKIRFLIVEEYDNYGDFAESISLSRAWLSNVLNSEKASPNVISKIAKSLNVNIDEILIEE